MANELSLSANLAYSDANGVKTELGLFGVTASAGNTLFTRLEMSINTTETALVLGGVTTLGYALFINRDGTNNINLKNQAGGTIILSLEPGIPQLYKFGSGITAPVAIALTAACKLEYIIVSG